MKKAFLGLVLIGMVIISANSAKAEAPFKVDFPWGSFELNKRVADKVKNKQAINFVLSIQTVSAIQLAAQQGAGIKKGAELMGNKYGVKINERLIGPLKTDPAAQIAEIQALLDANQIDVLAIQPPNQYGFEGTIEKAMKQGIPVFTDNSDAPKSIRISFIGPQDETGVTGEFVAEFVLKWAKEKKFTFTAIADTTGDDTAEWSQGRSRGFQSAIKEALPTVKIYGKPNQAAVVTGWDSADMYSRVKAFLIGQPDVNFLFNRDWGGAPIAQVIKDLGLDGKVYVMGFNVDEKILAVVGRSGLAAVCDQLTVGQGEETVRVAMQFLFEGIVPKPLHRTPVRMVTGENADEVKKELEGYTKPLK